MTWGNARQVGLSRGITMSLIALGDLQERQGAFEAAAALYGQALQRAKETGEMANWSQSLLRLAGVHRDQERFAEAMIEADRAFAIAHETGALGLEAQAVFAQAELNRLQGNLVQALAGFDQAVFTLAKAPDPELEWQVHFGKGLTLADSGQKDSAISSLRSAITLIEGVRDRLREDRFKAGYVQNKYQVYVELVRLQLETGRVQDAFSTAERLRSRTYLDLIESSRSPDPSQESQLLEYELKERIRTLRTTLAEENNRTRPEQRQAAISVYSQELLVAEQDYQAFLDDRRRSGAISRKEMVPTYADVGTMLSADEALIEYVVGSESVMLFVLTKNKLVAETVPLRRDNLQNKVELLRHLIRRQDQDHWKKPAASLARFLLEPVLSGGQLEGVKHLYLVPHGILNYLPFALLPSHGSNGSQRLIEDFTLAYLPTAAALLMEHKDSEKASTMLAMAPARSRLQHAFDEALAINSMFEPDSRVLVGKTATESTFKQLASQYRLLHFATHGYFNKLNPLLSGLELEADAANDGQLELHEILGLRLDADLVTLSACQTGLGSGHFAEIPAGDDFVGLTRAFLYAGSESVLATLWEVDDASTLELMISFYGALRQPAFSEDKASALAHAQRAFLSSKDYKHPYFWAPFVLVGDMVRNKFTQS
jgi:CHAT domain-containing protein